MLLIVAELLSVPLVVAATLLCILGGALLLALGQLLLHRRARTGLLRWWRRVVWTAIGGFGLLVFGLVIIELLLFAPALRIALDQIELRSGVDVTFRSARGSLFLGRLELDDVTVRRSGGQGVDFSLTIRSLELDADLLLEFNRCILCGLCARASEQYDGKAVFALGGHGIASHLVVNSASGRLVDSDIHPDDLAANICPVGVILKKRRGFDVPIGQRLYDRLPISSAPEDEAP